MGRPRRTPEQIEQAREEIRNRTASSQRTFRDRLAETQAAALEAAKAAGMDGVDVMAEMGQAAPQQAPAAAILAANGEPARAQVALPPAQEPSNPVQLLDLADRAFEHFKAKGLDSGQAAQLVTAYAVMELAATVADAIATVKAMATAKPNA